MTQGRWTTLAVLLLAALWLAGCGGDDGVKQDLEAQLEALMAERDAAKTAQATAEASRAAAAEASRAAAEEARATADAARKAADEARATAETERDAAQAAQLEAEAAEAEALAAQAEAEAAQTAAEAARDAAVKAKTAAETARDEARDAKTQAEIDLIAAQSAQALAERRRDAANTAKTTAKTAAETARAAALAARQTAETQRNEALAAKTTAENALAEANASKTTTEGELVTVRQQLVTANASLQTTQDALEDANDDLKDAQDDLDDLKDAQDNLQTANDELARVKKERDDAVRDLARAEGTLEGLRSQLTQAQQDVVDAEQRTGQAEAKANRRIEQAEEQANVNVRAPKLLAALDLSPDEEIRATVSRLRGGTLQFRPNGAYTRGSAAPTVPGSWQNRASFTRQGGTTANNLANETVYLYSDIKTPGSRPFWKVHGLSVTMTGSIKSLARGRSAQAGADTNPNVAGRQFSEVTISGSLNGTGGKFTCSASDCTCDDIPCGASTAIRTKIAKLVKFNQGQPTFTTIGEWTFEPSSLTASSYRMPQDDAYLYFGIWVSETVQVDGTPDFQYIIGGGGVTVNKDTGVVTRTISVPSNFAGLTGTAEFRGGAVGKYATVGQVGQQNAKIGTFTATATFAANFGDGSDEGNLHGQLTDFREGGNTLAGWRVTLGDTDNVGNATSVSSAATSGITIGTIGGVPVSGAWGAALRGSNNYDEFTEVQRVKYPKTKYPTADLAGVTGWFDATSDTAALAGAFGAACSTGTMCAR